MSQPPVLHIYGSVTLGAGREVGEVWIEDGVISLTRPSGLSGETVHIEGVAVPGLVDVHAHVGLGPGGGVGAEVAREQALADRDSGVLLIRDAGSPVDTRWMDAHEDLPRILRCGQHLALPKRYLRGFGRELAVPADLPAAAAEEAAAGDGWVKIVADWIDRDHGDLTPLWSAQDLAGAVAAAHAEAARVTAHTFAAEAVDDLLAAGVDCLEHGTGLTSRQIDEVVRRGVAVTPTLLQVGRFEAIAAQASEKFPTYAARMRAMHDRRYRHVADLYEAGVQLLVGTDAGGTITHGQIAAECAELVRAGIPASDVVAAASWQARSYLGFGELVDGSAADIVVYAADPRDSIAVLRTPLAVILRGQLVAPA